MLSQTDSAKKSRLRRAIAREGNYLRIAHGDDPRPGRYQLVDGHTNKLIAWCDTLEEAMKWIG
jgi:hypothetical protein